MPAPPLSVPCILVLHGVRSSGLSYVGLRHAFGPGGRLLGAPLDQRMKVTRRRCEGVKVSMAMVLQISVGQACMTSFPALPEEMGVLLAGCFPEFVRVGRRLE